MIIWIAAGLIVVVGIILLVLMLTPTLQKQPPTPNAFEAAASITVTHFALPATWTQPPPAQTDLPHATPNRLATLTPPKLNLPTSVIKLTVLPSLTIGPSVTPLPTTTHGPTVTPIPTTTHIAVNTPGSLSSPTPDKTPSATKSK